MNRSSTRPPLPLLIHPSPWSRYCYCRQATFSVLLWSWCYRCCHGVVVIVIHARCCDKPAWTQLLATALTQLNPKPLWHSVSTVIPIMTAKVLANHDSIDNHDSYRLGCRDLKPHQSALPPAKHAQRLQVQQQPQRHLTCYQAFQQVVQKLLGKLLGQHCIRGVRCKSPRDCR